MAWGKETSLVQDKDKPMTDAERKAIRERLERLENRVSVAAYQDVQLLLTALEAAEQQLSAAVYAGVSTGYNQVTGEAKAINTRAERAERALQIAAQQCAKMTAELDCVPRESTNVEGNSKSILAGWLQAAEEDK
jgi:hypothetical protein